MSTEKSASLYFKEGTSDKVYNATIEDVDGGYVVNFAYGTRTPTRPPAHPHAHP